MYLNNIQLQDSWNKMWNLLFSAYTVIWEKKCWAMHPEQTKGFMKIFKLLSWKRADTAPIIDKHGHETEHK